VLGEKKMYTFITNESGATALEYGVIAAVTCLGAIFMIAKISGDFNVVLDHFVTTIS
jgi:Flp pilus assembly pilin Flp